MATYGAGFTLTVILPVLPAYAAALSGSANSGEDAYRIFIDEIPSAISSSVPDKTAGLKLQMRYVLPLFLYHEEKNNLQPSLFWKTERDNEGSWIVISNQGRVHARLSNVFWGDKNQDPLSRRQITPGLLGYILPGQQMRWKVRQGLTAQYLFAQLADNTEPQMLPAGNVQGNK